MNVNQPAADRTAASLSSPDVIGKGIAALAARLFPLNRSITGDGVRETLDILDDHVHIDRSEVATGTRAFDWTVPREWKLRAAYIKDPSGRKIVDLTESNLHVMGYSTPVDARMTLGELKKHIHTLPEQPDLIPYRTSYYTEDWAFCMRHNEWLALTEGEYEVVIDSSLFDGSLTYGEILQPGAIDRTVLFSTHICHPSLANDNCAGLALQAFIAAALKERATRYTYRFLFIPGTIGALTWLSRNPNVLQHIDHGLVLSCIGDGGGPTYKRTRRGNTMIDRAVSVVRCGGDTAVEIVDFSPYGYDERQFNAPGFNLPVGQLQRSRFGTFPQYHTSADDLGFIRPQHLASSYQMVMDIIDVLETNWVPLNLFPMGEPQLGRRGLFSATGGHNNVSVGSLAFLWVLNLADGEYSLLDIAERSGIVYKEISAAADLLLHHGLLSCLRPG
ncbi:MULTISPECIES: DUF4910 domain-containing protein [unclassified Rhizobium]|uniref:DUF4910 domain-containing protein n=1 Tax=unclassified Rhizobium TaxID=2613769 RepID=UPI000715E129|nr:MULTISPECIES: DUF4910 domain-containing protein [unclassified Rhizobium]KQT04770.1 hypothetical protein ASG50_16035 [Rhizobium sp. Leaf386]KQT05136.1 hypothetical protein ASG42_21690 [Rhizobium sp. Leaf391]